MQSVGNCWKLHPARDYTEVLNRPSWHLLSDTRTPCLLRRKLRARWEVPGAAFLQTSLRSCVWGSPVNCQTSSYSESIILAVLWNDMFSRGDHTWSLSWSHMATKAVLEDALFTSTILWAFYCQETGMRSTGAGGRAECLHKGKTSLSLPEAQALHASGLGPPMVFVHFLMALLEPNTRPFSKRALAQ